MRICIQMLYTESWKDLALITVPNIVNYCRKHGYLWNIQCTSQPYDAFEKVRQIQTVFKANEADVVMSMDCDAIITNYTQKIEDYLDGEGFHVAQDLNGINCGIFIVVNSKWSENFLDKVLSYIGDPFVYCEQDAIAKYISVYGEENIKYLPHPSINSYLYELYPQMPAMNESQGQWVEKSFILHLAALGMDKRLEILNEYKHKIVYE